MDKFYGLWIACMSVFIVPLSGCAASHIQSSVPAFAQAVTLTTTNTQSAFQTVEQKYEAVQAASLVVDYDKAGFNPNRVKDWLTPEDLEVRMKLLKALQAYGSSLEEISGGDQLQQLDTNGRDLGSALTQLSKSPSLERLTSQAGIAPNVATTAIDSLGHWLIERKRNKELPGLIEQMQEPVKTVCELLEEDIGAHQEGTTRGKGLRGQLWDEYTELIRDQDEFIQHNQGKLTPSEKRSEVEKLPTLVREQRQADQLLAQTQAALQQLIKANEQLLQATKTKQDLHSDVSALVVEGMRIKDFYESLSSSK